MKSRYQEYMDRQTVSPDLHVRLLSLDQRQGKVIRPLRWQRWAAAAASLVLVAGIGWFGIGQMRGGSRAAESTVLTSEYDAGTAGAEAAVAESADMESGEMEESAMDTVAEREESAMDTADMESAQTESALPDELAQYATDYVGDAVNVSHIAQNLDYPGLWQYDHIELQTEREPYGLTIFLTGGTADADFSRCAEQCFALIGNLGTVTFSDGATGEPMAQFDR